MRRAFNFFLYVACFGLARGSLFISPIVVSSFLSHDSYGIIETTQAIGSITAILFGLGTASVVPLVLLSKIGNASMEAIFTHQIIASAALLLIFAIGYIFDRNLVWLSALCSMALLLQTLWSATHRSEGRNGVSLFLDAGFWIVIATTAMIASNISIFRSHVDGTIIVSLSLYVGALLYFTINNYRKTQTETSLSTYISTLNLGFPVMLAGLLTLLATTSGRLGMGLLSTPEMAADYAALFRGTSLPIVAHQLILVSNYKKIFKLPPTDLGKSLFKIVGFVTLCVIVFLLASTPLSPLLGSAFSTASSKYRTESLLILCQCILWSACSLNEIVCSRSQISATMVRVTTYYFLAALPISYGYLSHTDLSIKAFVITHSAVMIGYFMTQVYVISKDGIALPWTWATTLVAFFFLSFLSAFA
jgi:hypothetical protein